MSILYYDVADFASAERLAQVVLQMNGMPYRINSYIQLARTLAMQGRTEDALQGLYYAADLSKRHHIIPMQATVARTIAWVAMRQQDEVAVRHWLQSVEALLQEQISRPRPSAPEEVSLLAGAESYLLVGEVRRSLALLNPLEDTIRSRGRKLLLVRLKALQAAAYFALGDMESSFAALDEVLAILTPTRFISTAADIGAPLLAVLMRYAIDQGENPTLKHLIACAQLPLHKLPNSQQVLSYRELEVLRLVAIGDSNQEIAARLYLSESTVKTHLKRIFAKLKASSRTQAVAQARALALI